MNFEESLRVIPSGLVDLYEKTLEWNTPATWKRLSDCILSRMEMIVEGKRELSAVATRAIASQKALIDVSEKIKSTPKTPLRSQDLLDLAFEQGITFAIMSLDKAEYEALSKLDVEKDGQFEALVCFSETIREQMGRMGIQQGPSYFRGPDAKYSGPQNPPLKPSGDKDFIMSESECWCPYCNEKVEKGPDDLLKPCEMLVHTKCSRMLGSKVTMPDDKRVYDYGNLKKHPHSGTET